MSIEKPILLPLYTNLPMNPQKQLYPFLINKTLRLAVWTVPWKSYLQEAFRRQLPNKVCDDQRHYQIIGHPGHRGLTGVIKEKLSHFNAI